MQNITRILSTLESGEPNFPPTLLYNEGWILRLLLDWFSRHPEVEFKLNFQTGARWFSEAHLPTAFKPRKQKDPLGEKHTHADGVIGHFIIGSEGKADISLLSSANQFIVIEAKMFSKLSSRVTNASFFDQAARNVACMVEVLYRAEMRELESLSLGFCLLAPQAHIDAGKFPEMGRDSIKEKVKKRVAEYDGEKDGWHEEWFLPTVEQIELVEISWEEIISFIRSHDPDSGEAFQKFYSGCLRYN